MDALKTDAPIARLFDLLNRREFFWTNAKTAGLALGAGLVPGIANATEARVPRIYRLYDGPDGISTAGEVTFESIRPAADPMGFVASHADEPPRTRTKLMEFECSLARISSLQPSPPDNFHWGNPKQLVYFIQGNWELVAKSGKVIQPGPGDFLLAEDTGRGGGHTTRVIGPEWGLYFAVS